MKTNELLLTMLLIDRAKRMRMALNPDADNEALAAMPLDPFIAQALAETESFVPEVRRLLGAAPA